jgi:Predicted kinase
MHQETPAAARRRTPGSRSRADPSPGAPALRPVVVHELRVKCLVGVVQIVLILAPLYERSHRALVVVARHPHPSRVRQQSCIIACHPARTPGRVAFEQVAAGARGGTRVCQAGAVSPSEPGTAVALPDPALVVLVGASGSGKSAWAAEHYRPDEVVSSDRLRALAGAASTTSMRRPTLSPCSTT